MTEDELRSTFHVEHHSLVPEYQLIKLHHVTKRHVQGAADNLYQSTNKLAGSIYKSKSAHDKLSNLDYRFKNSHKFADFNVHGAPPPPSQNNVQDSLEDVEFHDDDIEDGVHKIKFEAFGKPVELKLKKTEGLFKKTGLQMWTVVGNETEPHGVELIENKEVSLYIFFIFYRYIFKKRCTRLRIAMAQTSLIDSKAKRTKI